MATTRLRSRHWCPISLWWLLWCFITITRWTVAAAFLNLPEQNNGAIFYKRIQSSVSLTAETSAATINPKPLSASYLSKTKTKTISTKTIPTSSSTTISVSNGQQQQQQQTQKKRNREPWRASYHVSKKTQQKIQQAAEDRRGTNRLPIERATAVLETLLKMPAERCNAANLVCALTLSAKVGPSSSIAASRERDNFRTLLRRVLDILHELVVVQQALNARQLCNSIWAIAKHYDRDNSLLPSSPRTAGISANQLVIAETWDLSGEDDGNDDSSLSSSQKLEATIQATARQLTEILTKETQIIATEQDSNKVSHSTKRNNSSTGEEPRMQRETKLGELCMASWAFGVLRPRQRPPGWLAPPQLDKVPQFQKQEKTAEQRKKDFITFEQWTLNDEDFSFVNPQTASLKESEDAADDLFDAIGETLCRPLENDVVIEPSVYDPPFDLMRTKSCTWSEIANVAWAFEKRGRCLSPQSEMLLRVLAREAGWRLRTGGREARHMLSRDISQLIWALGALQQDNFRLAHDLVELVDSFSLYLGLDDKRKRPRPFANWSCPDIVQVILSLAHARIDDSRLLLALFEEAHGRLAGGISTDLAVINGRKTFLAWEVSVMLWAQARLYLTCAEGDVYAHFPNAAARSIQSKVKNRSLSDIGIGQQEQANTAWALTVLRQHQTNETVDILRGVFREAAKACQDDGLIQLEHAHQLYQALFLLEEESPASVNDVPRWFRDYLSEKWDLEKSRNKISSARHKSISQTLGLMGVAHRNEHDEDIDVAIVLKDKASWSHQTETGESMNAMKVAVEFDGPNHFTRKDSPGPDRPSGNVRALGHTVLKYRLLKKKGWAVVRVPYYEWDKIPFFASMERQRYLQRLLKTHANIKFSDIDISEYRSLANNRKSRFD